MKAKESNYLRGEKTGYNRTMHKGFTKRSGRGMTEGDVRERIGCIRVKVHKWDDSVPIGVRSLREILGSCGYYMTRDNIIKITSEGQLKGRKFGGILYYPKKNLYAWVRYLEELGIKLLIQRGVIKQGGIAKDSLELIGRKTEEKRFKTVPFIIGRKK